MAKKSAQRFKMAEQTVKQALASLDSGMLKEHLNAVIFDEPQFNRLLGIVRRDTDFLIKRPDPKRRKARERFVNDLRSFLASCSIEGAGLRLDEMICELEQIEEGYGLILTALDTCAAAKLPPLVQASAAISRARANCELLLRQSQQSMAASPTVIPQSFRATAPDGTSYSPDGVLEAVNTVTAMALKLLAHRNRWFDANGVLILPETQNCSEDNIAKAGAIELLAASWRHWERVEQRSRYFEGTIEKFSRDNSPVTLPKDVRAWFRYDHICDAEICDYLAHYRLNNRMTQTFLEMILKTDVESLVKGLLATDLAPIQLASAQEAHACQALSEMLGYDISSNSGKPGGLRLVEWLRGYVVLQLLATESYEQNGAEGFSANWARQDLVATLENSGLKNGCAELFIDRATFHKSSRDLFDQPLLKRPDGQITIIALGLLDSDPARLTLSAIGNIGEKLEGKGEAFEAAMLIFFREQGLEAQPLKFREGAEEYQFDILLSWQGKVFLFECKNLSLSGQSATSCYYFHKEMVDAQKQVRRQADALILHADRVEELCGIQVTPDNLVPCVVNSLPYAIPGDQDGVIVTDASTIKRFFQDRHVHSIRPHSPKKGTKVLHRTALTSLWSGDAPDARDFIRYLNDPVTLKMSLAHIEIKHYPFALDQHHRVQACDLGFNAMTPESVAAVFSLDPASIEKEQNAVSRAIRTAQARGEMKALAQTKRAWRERAKRQRSRNSEK